MRLQLGSKWIIAAWVLIGLGLATQYNACSQQVVFSQSLASIRDQMLSGAAIVINGDAQFTNDTNVEVDLQDDLATEVYVTNDKTCNSGGTWEPMQTKRNWTLSAKNQEVAVYARYRNTQEGTETECVSDTIIHDDQKPEILLNQPNMITNVNAPVFNFLAWDSISGIKETTCLWPGSTSADKCDFSSSHGNLAEGTYNVNVVATDKAGNIGDTIVQYLMVDRTPPTVIINSAPAAVSAVSTAAFDFTGQDNLSGVKSYECAKEGATSFAACTSPLNWPVSEGAHKFFVRAIDAAGNVSPASEADFTIDMTAPTVQILSGPNDFSNSTNATFTFNGTDMGQPITNFECHIDANAFAACSSPAAYTGLADGSHMFYVRGVDDSGNKSSPVSRTWIIDTKAPVVAWVTTPPAFTNSTSGAFRYTVTDASSGVAGAQCSLDGAAFASCDVASYTASGLAGGTHQFQVIGVDKAGNKSAPLSYSWTIDNTPPTLVLTSGPSALSNSATATFQYTATDAGSGVAEVDCRLDAAAYAPCQSVTSDVVTGLMEGARKMSIRAVDKAGNMSSEVVVNWTVDLTGPDIAYFQQPLAAISPSYKQQLGFTVTDSLSGVDSVSCTLNGSTYPCTSGTAITFPASAAGNYNFVVTALDKAGNKTVSTKTWVVNTPILHTQNVNVQSQNKVDVVVIIDNSGSMESEMKAMGTYFGQFLTQLKGLDWQVGIITTDPRTSPADAVKEDGRLVEYVGMPGTFILTSAMDFNSANTAFKNTIQMKADGSGSERGILTAKRSIQRAFDGKAVNANSNKLMFRDDAALAFVVVSDAYDDVSQPSDLINEVKAHWNGQKVFAFHSLVVPENSFTNPKASKVDPADPCADYRESVQYDGRIYYQLSDLTGGIKGTECSMDYGSQLSQMGKATVALVTSAALDCAPVDNNGDGVVDGGDVVVTSMSGSPISGVTVNGNKLSFSAGLPAGTNTVKYYCYQ